MDLNKVDLFICGAGKSGTSLLSEILGKHPDVSFSNIKEPRFFTNVKKSAIYPADGLYHRGKNWYHSLFNSKKKLRGEASTMYFTAIDSPYLIHDYNPDAKIVFLLRHPVKRYYSHYWQEVKTGRKLANFNEVKNNKRISCRYHFNSKYSINIERFRSYFRDDNIHVMIFEEFIRNKEQEIKKLFNFLNLPDTDIVWPQKVNSSGVPRSKLIGSLYHFASNAEGSISHWLPNNIYTKVRSGLTHLYKKFNIENKKYNEISSEDYNYLYEEFIEDIEYVEHYLNKDIEDWH